MRRSSRECQRKMITRQEKETASEYMHFVNFNWTISEDSLVLVTVKYCRVDKATVSRTTSLQINGQDVKKGDKH